jgi:hypothetical protein
MPAIARLVAAHDDTVRDVIHAFNDKGLAALNPRWAVKIFGTADKLGIPIFTSERCQIPAWSISSACRFQCHLPSPDVFPGTVNVAENPPRLPEVLQDVVEILMQAFPTGIGPEDYDALLTVLSEGLGEENLGKVVAAFTGTDQYIVINDAAAVASHRPAKQSKVDEIRRRLESFGWTDD